MTLVLQRLQKTETHEEEPDVPRAALRRRSVDERCRALRRSQAERSASGSRPAIRLELATPTHAREQYRGPLRVEVDWNETPQMQHSAGRSRSVCWLSFLYRSRQVLSQQR